MSMKTKKRKKLIGVEVRQGPRGFSVRCYVNVDGKRFQEHIGTTFDEGQVPQLIEQAQSRRLQMLRELRTGSYSNQAQVPSILESLTDFEGHLTAQCTNGIIRKSTLCKNILAMRTFIEFLNTEARQATQLHHVTPELLTKFLQWLKDVRNQRPATQGLTLSTLHKWSGRMVRKGQMKDPFDRDVLSVPRGNSAPQRRMFTLEEFEKVLRHFRDKNDLDMADLIVVVRWGGFRLSEACNLRYSDCNFERGELRICAHDSFKPKSSAGTRSVPVPQDVVDLLRARALRLGVRENDLLFPAFQSLHAERSSSPVPMIRLRKALKSLGLYTDIKKGTLSFHGLRHLRATEIYNHPSVSPWTGMKLMGHSSTAVASKYIHISGQDLRNAITAVQGQ